MAGNNLSGKSRCEISYRDIEKNREEFLELVSEPKFVCKKCRRLAADKKNLCKGKKLKSSGEKSKVELVAV